MNLQALPESRRLSCKSSATQNNAQTPTATNYNFPDISARTLFKYLQYRSELQHVRNLTCYLRNFFLLEYNRLQIERVKGNGFSSRIRETMYV